MQRFTQAYLELDQTTRTSEKTAALVRYFRDAAPRDAAWALHVLTGRRLIRGISHTRLRTWVSDETGLPLWLVNESYDAVGDLSETLALLLPDRGGPSQEPLHVTVEQRILPLAKMTEAEQRNVIVRTWREFDRDQRFLFHKLIAGTFRVGAAQRLVIKALAEVADVDPAIMQHRLTGRWEPTAADFERLISGEEEGGDPGRPYPFYLAHPLEADPEALGDLDDWQVEWKWDGIRAQLLHRRGQVMLWSRGEELITDTFPEITEAAAALPEGTVLDGEVVAWEDDRPLPFGALQRRLNRKRVQPRLFAEVPVVFMAYDLLERDGEDLREMPLIERRAALEGLVRQMADGPDGDEHQRVLRVSPTVNASSWTELATFKDEARERGVEGLMLKRKDAPYRVGRVRGEWWKWKIDPFTIDCVMVHAQHGHGKRAGLFTDYTFAVWDNGELVPVAKAYSGLSAEEIERVDRWVRSHTLARHGPVRTVEPALVFELAFEDIRPSTRHRSGVALRFPRIARWRTDKSPAEADTLEALQALLRQQEQRM